MNNKIFYAVADTVPEMIDGVRVLVLRNDVWYLNEQNEQLFIGSVALRGLVAHKLYECTGFDYRGCATVLSWP